MTQRWQSVLEGSEGLEQYTTSGGVVYCISPDRKRAWPRIGPATAYGPYDTDVAAGTGQEVDISIPANDYRVRGAGSAWREVYEYLLEG